MQIAINEKYQIVSDRHNVIIQEKKLSNPTEKRPEIIERWENVTYHPDLESACNSLLQLEIRLSDKDTIDGLLDGAREIKNDIVRAVKNIKI